jgi:high-affinity iron transporter
MNSPLIEAVLVVLREVLEFALLVGMLLAAGAQAGARWRWLPVALLAGVAGAAGYAHAMRSISGWFDGVGYEVVNAGLQIGVYALLLAVINAIARRPAGPPGPLAALTGLATALAVTREGAEILLYLSAFQNRPNALADLLLGAVLGVGVGFSAGTLLYYLLRGLPHRIGRPVTLALLALTSAGMWAQASALLTQADWLPASAPLWDTSGWIPEGSVAGQLLYALMGYEATPGAWQVGLAATSLVLALGVAVVAARASEDADDD